MLRNSLAILLTVLAMIGCSTAPRYGIGPKGSKPTKEARAGTGSYPMIQTGMASFYAEDFHGKLTANGETYDMYGLTAAHKTLPLNTLVRVTNLDNKKSVVLRINDRGPYAKGRILDCSYGAAMKLGFAGQGTARVRIEVIELGDDERIKHRD